MRHASVFDLWGSGGGFSSRLSPCTRVFCGILVFFVPLISNPIRWEGLAISLTTTIIWIGVTAIPERRILAVMVMCSCLFLPLFLLTPWIPIHTDQPGASPIMDFACRLQVPFSILFKGTSSTLIASATIASLRRHEFEHCLGYMPLPSLIKKLTRQIIVQTGLLFNETRQIVQMISVRGAEGGLKATLLLIRSLPTTWLPRLAQKADTLASSMEIRGYDGRIIGFEEQKFTIIDGLSMTATFALFSIAFFLRWTR